MERLIRHLLHLSVTFFDRQSHGDIIQAVRQDVTELRTVVMA
jgi:ABC-type multidrug transport system fused ATPase/permease subunit